MTNSNNVTNRYEDERARAAEQSQLTYLQGQIDELRRQIKEQTNKYHWVIEQVRKVEGEVGQVDGILDRHRQEVAQALDAQRRDIVALRKEIAAAVVKVDEGQRPLRELQTQIQQVAEARKQDRDQVAGWLVRIEELEVRMRDWNAQLNTVDERYRGLGGRLDGLYAADETVRTEIRKVNEDLQVEKQSLRRQAIEVQQLVHQLDATLDDHMSRITRLDEIRQQIELFANQLPEQVAVIETRLTDFTAEVKRIERIGNEHFLVNQERLEDMRHQQDEKVVSLQESDDHTQRQFTAWLERIDGMVRELEQRLARTVVRIDTTQREQATQLMVLEQRDVELVESLLAALRDRAERVKADQIERGVSQPQSIVP